MPFFFFFFTGGLILISIDRTYPLSNNKKLPSYSLDNMPTTDFTCRDKILGGYYADAQTQCQMFHVCVKVAGVGVSKIQKQIKMKSTTISIYMKFLHKFNCICRQRHMVVSLNLIHAIFRYHSTLNLCTNLIIHRNIIIIMIVVIIKLIVTFHKSCMHNSLFPLFPFQQHTKNMPYDFVSKTIL